MMSVAAFGDVVIGPYVRDMLGQPGEAMRDLTAANAASASGVLNILALLFCSLVLAGPLTIDRFGSTTLPG